MCVWVAYVYESAIIQVFASYPFFKVLTFYPNSYDDWDIEQIDLW